MAGDLNDLMARAAHDVERATAPAPTETLSHVRSTVRRRRVRRHAAESFGAMAVVGAVAAAFLVGRPAPQPADPTPSPTASASASPSTSPTPSPSSTPTGPPVREDEIDDATALARLGAPRTGEVWIAPTRVDAPVTVDSSTPQDWYHVGSRGDAQIYAVTRGTDDRDDLEAWLTGLEVTLYEREGDTLRHVACPSARTGDACGPDALEGVPAQRDEETFYDSLTPPRSVTLPDGYVVRTGDTWGTDGAVTGSMAAAYWGSEVRQVADVGGGVQLVERTLTTLPDGHPFAGTRNVVLALRLPYGALVELEATDVPGGDSASIVWDDGVTRAGELSRTWAPAGSACDGPAFSILPGDLDTSAWVRAGTVDGRPVHVPAPGRVDLARQVFTFQQQNSYELDDRGITEGAEAYRMTSLQQLLDEKALFALEGPDGRWMLGLRGDAVNSAYECA